MAGELTWRWCFGLGAWGLTILSIVLFLDSLKISPRDELLLATFQPQLLQRAAAHILGGRLGRLVWEQATLTLGLTLLWALAASAGRAATLRRLVAMFRADDDPEDVVWKFAPVFWLCLWRAIWTLIALAVALGSLAGGVIMAHNQRAALAALLLSFGVGLSWAFGIVLNWFLGLAPLFCIRNDVGTAEALGQSVDFSSRQTGTLFGLGFAFAMLRLIWAGTMSLAVLAPLRLAHHIARGWIGLIMASVALVYFAGADLLYLARLAAYVSLAEDESHPVDTLQAPSPAVPPPDFGIASDPEPALPNFSV